MGAHETEAQGPQLDETVKAVVMGDSPYQTQEFAILEDPETHASDVNLSGLTADELKDGVRTANYLWFEGIDTGDPTLELRGEKVADACISELARRQSYKTHHQPKNKLGAAVTKAFDKVFGV